MASLMGSPIMTVTFFPVRGRKRGNSRSSFITSSKPVEGGQKERGGEEEGNAEVGEGRGEEVDGQQGAL